MDVSNKKLYIGDKELALTPEMKEDLYKAAPGLKDGRGVSIVTIGLGSKLDPNTGTMKFNRSKNIQFSNTVPFDGKRVVSDLTKDNAQLATIRIATGYTLDKNQEPVWKTADLYLQANPNIEIPSNDLPLAYFLLFVSGEIVGNECPVIGHKKYRQVKVHNPATIALQHTNRDRKLTEAKAKLYALEMDALRQLSAHFEIANYGVLSEEELNSAIVLRIDADATVATAERVIQFCDHQHEYAALSLINDLKAQKKIAYDAEKKSFFQVEGGVIGGLITEVAGENPEKELEAVLMNKPTMLRMLTKLLR